MRASVGGVGWNGGWVGMGMGEISRDGAPGGAWGRVPAGLTIELARCSHSRNVRARLIEP